MENKCEIIQDLLFCYNDGIASESTKKLVENHLNDCDSCKKFLEEIKKDKNDQNDNEEINYLWKINKRMKRKTIITTISIIILIIFLLINLFILYGYYNESGYVNIYLKDSISNEQLEDITKVLEVKCGKEKIEYSSKENELNKVKKMFENKGKIIESYQQDNPFKAVFTVKTKIEQVEKVVQNVQELEGIEKITTNTINNPYIWFASKIYNRK